MHGRTNVRRNTVDPSWEGEEFHFSCSEAEDAVEIEIKDKFAKSRPTISRNLGRDEDLNFCSISSTHPLLEHCLFCAF